MAAWLVVSLTALAFDSYKLLTVLAVLLPLGLFLRTVFQYGKVSPGNSAYALYGTVYICAGFWSLLVLRSGMIGSYFRDDFASVILDPGRFFVFLLVFPLGPAIRSPFLQAEPSARLSFVLPSAPEKL